MAKLLLISSTLVRQVAAAQFSSWSASIAQQTQTQGFGPTLPVALCGPLGTTANV
jgi:hypothetical protein